MTGSVFGNDSTIIIDGTSNTLNGNIDNINTLTYATPLSITNKSASSGNVKFINNAAASSMALTVEAIDAQGLLTFTRNSTSDLSGNNNLIYGGMYFGVDDSNGRTDTALMLGYEDKIVWAVDENAAPVQSQHMVFNSTGNLGVGNWAPTEKLVVAGNAKASGFIQTGSFTTAERDALTGAEGMILYNSTTNQLESYENSAWGATGGAGGGASIGNFTFASSVVDTDDSSGIVITPAVTMSSDLTVENDLVVSNTVTAGKFVSTGTETPEISAGANLNLTAGNAVVITSSPLRMASFTTTERNALAAQNGDIIYNTTDNKFQGYENGAWANLI